MNEQVLIQFRADKELKNEVADIYESLGMDLPTAFRMFMLRSKMVNGLPFDAILPPDFVARQEFAKSFDILRKQAKSVPEMSLDEINQEISEARKARGC